MAILLTEAAKLSNEVPRNPPPTKPSRQRPPTNKPPFCPPSSFKSRDKKTKSN